MKTEILPSEIIARNMMEVIQYDNGVANRLNPASYTQGWINKIREKVLSFILQNPRFDFTNQVTEDFCIMEDVERITKYGHLPGYDALVKVLNDYFNQL